MGLNLSHADVMALQHAVLEVRRAVHEFGEQEGKWHASFHPETVSMAIHGCVLETGHGDCLVRVSKQFARERSVVWCEDAQGNVGDWRISEWKRPPPR